MSPNFLANTNTQRVKLQTSLWDHFICILTSFNLAKTSSESEQDHKASIKINWKPYKGDLKFNFYLDVLVLTISYTTLIFIVRLLHGILLIDPNYSKSVE